MLSSCSLIMHPFTQKYSPKRASDIIGQQQVIAKLLDFASNHKKQKKKAALIYGPTGSGKTCAAYLIARQLDLEIVEVNASDFRNAEGINAILGNAMKQMSLFFKGKIILVDEIDGLAGNQDRGGVQAII